MGIRPIQNLRCGNALKRKPETRMNKKMKIRTTMRLEAMDEEMRKKKGKWPPHKVVAQECQMQVACKVLYLDMVGHADNLAHEKLVELAAPQRLVVVHGHPSATANFTAVSRARGLS